MEKLVIKGGRPLHGRVRVSSAKNAVLPIIVATLLPDSPATIIDAPNLEDVRTISSVIESLGGSVIHKGNEMIFDTSMITKTEASYDLMSRMRASFLVMGPLLAKKRHAKIALPGGCMIGSRPIDLHLKAFEAMGAEITIGNGFVEALAPNGLKGATIYLDFPSVGATENILMAAVLAEGKTIIENAAEEPEIVDLVTFLSSMGANIKGAGTNVIRIEGVKHLYGASHTVIPDRIEAGTFIIAAAMVGGDVVIENVLTEHLKPLLAKLSEAGVVVEKEIDSVHIISQGRIKSADIKTLPYPGFPTDLQAQFMAMMTVGDGVSTITETVFENRFMHVGELCRMGADIRVEGRKAIVHGVPFLQGAFVRATDLRAGAALVLAGLAAHGVTEIGDLHHIDRGYDHLVEKLRGLGADIVRVDKD
ncbi:UDP-N-acetylglucosamine 1-carboxyvinyltransferase [Dialister pneumosintes]|uniref:UDP-N-acetylglucosamine 1-carboxyvinyltransferase n=1 Tax=Dialister pneumosintes TaxID=39950 RepID=A0ABX9MBA8_9FIRM|nr:UDP-N-acetylglucosamine 1-carboxyvinyltransferase [Dialister pneumosintes]RID94988.1 UDP-N-acetylglucosamine 1-carboxyvinyltransferase [Dialister pneumosintes]CDF27817.1 uDP-N-acetylglucosamine 1-carboxyvinyltransferase [Dialister sp. CAG:588]